MNKILAIFILAAALFVTFNTTEAATRVRGYYRRSTGTYIAPHYRSNPNHTRFDNWSTRGNYNPFTGSRGYKSPYNFRLR